ncbi:hypothetical protein ACWDUL_21065 [Nocardia niigatensis]
MNDRETTVWGKAGQRLTTTEIQQRRHQILQARNKAVAAQAALEAEGRRLWRAGRLIPWRITIALDHKGLEGPGVDIACGATEPAVDQWEAGILYPTWEQTRLLAELCGVTVPFLCAGDMLPAQPLCRKWNQHHADTPPPVTAFQPEAITRTLTAEGMAP